MKKEFTLRAKAMKICGLVFIMIFGMVVFFSWKLDHLKTIETDLMNNVDQESEIHQLVSNANHHTTKMASSFKNVLLRGETTNALEKHKKEFHGFIEKFDEETGKILPISNISNNPERLKKIETWREEFKKVSTAYSSALARYDSSIPFIHRELDHSVKGIDRPVVEQGVAILKESEASSQTANRTMKEALDEQTNSFLVWLMLGLSGILFGLCLSLIHYARSIRDVLGEEPYFLVHQASKIASGDLSSQDMSQLKPNPDSVVFAFEKMRVSLRDLAFEIRKRSTLVQKGLGTIRDQLCVVDTSAETQSSSSSNMASALEEISVGIAQLFELAKKTKKIAENSSSESDSGLRLMVEASDNVERTTKAADQLSTSLQNLGTRSEQITHIVRVIEGIAQQTNLLALNAAIEAARAGEQGRGFAVVADEVRRLAERTSQSTSEIEKMVAAIQDETRQVVSEMDEWIEKIGSSASRMNTTQTVIRTIKQLNCEVNILTSEVSGSLLEQKSATGLLTNQVEKYAALSKDNAKCVGDIRLSLSELDSSFSQLTEQSEKFKA